MHKLLEHLLRRPDLTPAQLGRLARWTHLDHDPAHIPAALQAVEHLRTTPIWTRCLAARQRLIEVPLAHRRGDTLHFLTLDLVLDEPDGYALIDWKTDRLTPQQLTAHCTPQLAAYAESWEAVVAPVASQCVIAVRPPDEIRA